MSSVLRLMPSSSAMAVLDLPMAIISATWRWRGVRLPINATASSTFTPKIFSGFFMAPLIRLGRWLLFPSEEILASEMNDGLQGIQAESDSHVARDGQTACSAVGAGGEWRVVIVSR